MSEARTDREAREAADRETAAMANKIRRTCYTIALDYGRYFTTCAPNAIEEHGLAVKTIYSPEISEAEAILGDVYKAARGYVDARLSGAVDVDAEYFALGAMLRGYEKLVGSDLPELPPDIAAACKGLGVDALKLDGGALKWANDPRARDLSDFFVEHFGDLFGLERKVKPDASQEPKPAPAGDPFPLGTIVIVEEGPLKGSIGIVEGFGVYPGDKPFLTLRKLDGGLEFAAPVSHVRLLEQPKPEAGRSPGAPFPKGTRVRVTGGMWEGCIGVIESDGDVYEGSHVRIAEKPDGANGRLGHVIRVRTANLRAEPRS